MTQNLTPARWAVISEFQRRCGNRDVNSFECEVADHAVSLALNPNRPFDSYFARDAWRDAKSIVLRRRRRQKVRFVPLYEEGDDVELSSEVQDALGAPDRAFPGTERALVWADAYSRLRSALGRRNRYAVRCLDAWRDGEAEQETAVALGISRDYVKKLRRLIRDTAAEVLFSGEEWVQ